MTAIALLVVLAGAVAGRGVEPPSVESDRLVATLRELPGPRSARGGDAEGAALRATERMISERLTALGFAPVLEPIRWSPPTHREPVVWNNIVVELKGSELPDQIFIVGAHFDSVPGSPGADDNGTGTAALLELARVLKDRPLKRTVRLVFFNLEEVGLIGSRLHAKGLAPPSGPDAPGVIGMVSLEMLGFFSDEPGSQRSPIKEIPGVFTPPTVGDFIALVTVQGYQTLSRRLLAEMTAASPDLKVMTADFLPFPQPDMLRSDHAPFMAQNIPAVMLTDTANFRNPNYHSAGDTVDTIDAERFAAVVRGLAGAIAAIADTGLSSAQRTPAPQPSSGGAQER